MFDLRIPVATYRLQFNRQFRFEDARDLVPYLHQLGISDLYVSPILKVRKGSSHGYDVTDPTHLNPELGTETDFDALVQELKNHKMGLLLDIVPNHMAASPENPWWMDVLGNGLCSPYAGFFDIDWGALDNRILLPILTRPYEETLENQELTLILEDAGLFIQYNGYRLPLDVKSYRLIISYCLDALEKAVGSSHPAYEELHQLIEAAEHLPSVSNLGPKETSKQYRDRHAVKESFLYIVKTSAETTAVLLQNITLFNGKRGEPRSFELMNNLLEQQVFRLAYWKTAREQLNYRRFFDISDLIGVRIEESQVFEANHSLVLRLIREGKVSGLRIDHIDGLNEPSEYLFRLQSYLVPQQKGIGRLPSFYVVVEKVLGANEELPPEWPVFGTTGYDFLNTANALFVDKGGIQALDTIYSQFTGSQLVFGDVIYEKKRQVMSELFIGEMYALGRHLSHLAQESWHNPHLSEKEITNALIEVTACLHIYRTYTRTLEVSHRDRLYLENAIQEAQRRGTFLEANTLDFIKHVLILDFPITLALEQKKKWLRFVSRWQQLTGAIMAKGFEDTALYTYNRLVSLNEVGGNPGSEGLSVTEFHHYNQARLEHWPYTLNATSTHDTKRSEDVRARINVLSEMPLVWENYLFRWSQWNHRKKQMVGGQLVPDPNMEMLLYQTLVGAWPLSEADVPEFKERFKGYSIKAAREAKVFSNWLSPNKEYEDGLLFFIETILECSDRNQFLKDFLKLQKQVAFYGALNALAQAVLKITSPGVADFYQGTELWDFSLVDPDNRRPVDFEKRMKLLNHIIQQEGKGQLSLVQQILTSWEDGQVKLYVTYKALKLRQAHEGLFLEGDYIPLKVRGEREAHVFAFARRRGENWALIAVPRLLMRLVGVGTFPVGRHVWGDDVLFLPDSAPKHWLQVFTREMLNVSLTNKEVPLSYIFSLFPVALLVST